MDTNKLTQNAPIFKIKNSVDSEKEFCNTSQVHSKMKPKLFRHQNLTIGRYSVKQKQLRNSRHSKILVVSKSRSNLAKSDVKYCTVTRKFKKINNSLNKNKCLNYLQSDNLHNDKTGLTHETDEKLEDKISYDVQIFSENLKTVQKKNAKIPLEELLLIKKEFPNIA